MRPHHMPLPPNLLPAATPPRDKGPQKRRHNRTHKKRKQGGGFFLPSIGESFVAAAAKYVAPLALYGIYKLATRKASGGKGRKRT